VRGWLAKLQFLRGRFREARTATEDALRDARAAGNRYAVLDLLDTRGMVLTALGEREAGIDSLRAAIELARQEGEVERLATSYSNLADMLLFAGRAREAMEVAREGLEETPPEHVRVRAWLTLTVSEVAFACGDWALAERCLSPMPGKLGGILFIFRMLREAELALGVGDEQRAADSLAQIADAVAASTEPQWIGLFGALAADLAARRGDLDGAQRAVAEALDRMEVCTEDIARIARVSLSGIAVEADRAQRARDLGDTAARRDALASARLHLGRLEACAEDGGPQEKTRAVHGRAEMARARGRGAANAYGRAARAWKGIELPYPAAIATWRRAECLAADGDREGAAAAANEALTAARKLGSAWLEREVRGLGERARLALAAVADGAAGPDGVADAAGGGPGAGGPRVGGPGAGGPGAGGAGAGAAAGASGGAAGGGAADGVVDPFGLTDRERQVLSLLAEGATNRQIGAALYMAEKTASVHVSRILAKLDVRGRTEAAAVAHRLHLTAPPGTVAHR